MASPFPYKKKAPGFVPEAATCRAHAVRPRDLPGKVQGQLLACALHGAYEGIGRRGGGQEEKGHV